MNADLAEIRKWALSLPKSQRIQLAQDLWDSIDERDRLRHFEVTDEFRAELRRRIFELDHGLVEAIPHDEVMRAARRAIQSRE